MYKNECINHDPKRHFRSTDTWGGGNPDQILQLQNAIKILEERILIIEQSRATTESFGMAKLSDSSSVTEKEGLALPSTEKNATFPGTLAGMISQLKSTLNGHSLNNIRFLGCLKIPDEEVGDIPVNYNVSADVIYLAVIRPMIAITLHGSNHFLVAGFDYDSHKKGIQWTFGPEFIKYRKKIDGVWQSWKKIQGS